MGGLNLKGLWPQLHSSSASSVPPPCIWESCLGGAHSCPLASRDDWLITLCGALVLTPLTSGGGVTLRSFRE